MPLKYLLLLLTRSHILLRRLQEQEATGAGGYRSRRLQGQEATGAGGYRGRRLQGQEATGAGG